jgi:hypothetical protein
MNTFDQFLNEVVPDHKARTYLQHLLGSLVMNSPMYNF